MDILLATATKPRGKNGKNQFPEPHEAADAWSECESKYYIDYFLNNRAHGITSRVAFPEPHEAADAWSECESKYYIDYFLNNRAHGITTFQDTDIENRLKVRWG